MKTKSALSLIILIVGLSYSFSIDTDKYLEHSTKNKEVEISLFKYEGQTYKPGDTVLGYKKYIKLVVGDIDAPLLLGVPHDGTAIGDPEIPETGKTGRDINTLPLAFKIAESFKKTTQKRSWIIINTIGRKRVDPNTFPDEVDVRYKNEDARKTYHSYHALLTAARMAMARFQKNNKGALFLDLHGHAHTYTHPQTYISTSGKILSSKFIDQTELGYGLSSYAISQDDAYLNALADSSSIAYLSKAHPEIPFSEMIRGAFSFGGLLEAAGVPAVPGNKIKTLEINEALFGKTETGVVKARPYFNGGFLIRKYGTIQKGKTITGFDDNIVAIQAETPGITVRNNNAIIEVSGERFNRAIVTYLNKWFGYNYKL